MENTELETKALECSFGQKTAVDKVSVHVKKAGIYVLAGKAASGKSVFLEMIGNQRTPGGGEIYLEGKKRKSGSLGVIGYLQEDPAFEENRTVLQNMKLKESLTPGGKGTSAEIMELLRINPFANKKVRELSTPVRKLTAIAMALVGWPKLVLLDDPCSFLDYSDRNYLAETLKKLVKDKEMTFLVAARSIDPVVKEADQLGFLCKGRLLREMTMEEFMEMAHADVRVRVDSLDAAKKVLSKFDVKEGDEGWLLVSSGSLELSAINEALMNSGVDVFEIISGRKSEDELFDSMMTGGRYA